MTARVSPEMFSAMKLFEEEGLNPSQAALRVGIHPSTVIRSRLYKDFLARKKEDSSQNEEKS